MRSMASGALTIAVSRAGDATTLSQIVRRVAAVPGARSQFPTLADRAAYWLTLIAVGTGTGGFVVWLAVGAGLNAAITRAVTVLAIAGSHVLGLAIPLVIVNATALAARHGILVRDREAIERARELTVVAIPLAARVASAWDIDLSPAALLMAPSTIVGAINALLPRPAKPSCGEDGVRSARRGASAHRRGAGPASAAE